MPYPKGAKRCTKIYPKLLPAPSTSPSYGVEVVDFSISDNAVAVKCRRMAVAGTEFCDKHQPQ